MPAPGDQYRDTPASVNPFRGDERHTSEYTAQQIATLQSRLEKQLGPEYISTRPGNGGGKVHYLAAEKVINLANEVFGFNGWSSSIQNVQIDFVDENATNGRINLGLSTIVRVTLKDGTFHEDIGYGHCENAKGKAAAFEKAKKEAATDAMKRALRNFGNVLGNCLYDKDYLAKVSKVKVAPSKWDADNLHRHPEYAPIKKEPASTEQPPQNKAAAVQRNTSVQSVQSAGSFGSAEFEDDFGGNIFDETDFNHPDEVRLDDTTVSDVTSPAKNANPPQNGPEANGQRQGVPRMHSMPQMRPPNVQPPAPVQGIQAPQRPQPPQRPPANAGQPANKMLPPHTPGNAQRPQQIPAAQALQNGDGVRSNPSSGSTTDTSNQAQSRPSTGPNGQAQRPDQPDESGFAGPRQPPQGIPEGFVTGRSADVLNKPAGARPPPIDLAFNPHAESPSIRRTQGINPGKSAPVSRLQVNGAASGSAQPAQQQQPAGGGFQTAGGNGMNGAPRPTTTNYVNPSADMNRRVGMPPAGGYQNRGGYRPPAPAAATKRSAMTDVTNIHQMDGASDPKKLKTDTATPAQGDSVQSNDSNGLAI
ncbi:hypothetical protein M409DRAFT_54552 [Zasmidium cellare ATCC 36951]|uniref:RAD52 homolog n=1 Tax=Zasmidium cellare ATCC 36951 TaxID=1080233 RepID=A0A6A6CLE5_ZASCE|nr:uncharacterized protein M409DRAFT_54552 [Zasmidium cellare ATCC 36951]KAF2166762.1 hypothetical protein M409DRAFT_54552 [Zasmidium cellare ATCC 36951]